MIVNRKSLFASCGVASFLAFSAVACSVTTSTPTPSKSGDAAVASVATKPKTAPSTSKIHDVHGSAPPAGAVSKGQETSPSAGAIVIPIQNVEVYVIQLDFDGDGTDDPVNWAYDNGTTYLWVTEPMTCSDGSVDPAGTFLMEIAEDGSGTYTYSLAACPASDFYGCDFDSSGNETTCGTCTLDDKGVITCVTAS